jgi:LDH2 family malate/lactate/ureidoglycolate dehydrogenase
VSLILSYLVLHLGGYKGYGLGFMVELFCGIMSGSAFGPHIRSWNKSDVTADLVYNNLLACFKRVIRV